MQRVAIEDSLGQVKELLKNKGFDVVGLGNQNNQVDAIIITGMDKDVMGMQEVATNAPVINAHGMTPEEVYQQLANQLKQ